MLTNAPILAIVPPPTLRALRRSTVRRSVSPTRMYRHLGRRCSIDVAAARFSRFTSALRRVRRNTPLPHGL